MKNEYYGVLLFNENEKAEDWYDNNDNEILILILMMTNY